MQTVGVFNTRGGTGKSAATVFLADFLSSYFSKRVLVVDLDPQRSSSVALLGEERLNEGFSENASLTLLLRAVRQAPPSLEFAASYLMERPAIKGRGRHRFLKSIQVLACERTEWHDFNEELYRLPASRQRICHNLLRDALEPLADEFDVCLIDFPGHDTGPMAKSGLHATDWWLLPAIPDRASTRDIEGPSRAIRDVSNDSDHTIRPLGTLLTICQNRSSNEYRKSKNALRRLAEQNVIPAPFGREAEISFDTAAKNALDELNSPSFRTLDQKYGGAAKPLAKSLRCLSKEVLQRIDMQSQDVTPLTFVEHVNSILTGFWR